MAKRPFRRSLTVVGDMLTYWSSEAMMEKSRFNSILNNSLSILIVLSFLVLFLGVYLIFEPFFKPLLWALLCGSALHPLKRKITLLFESESRFSGGRSFADEIISPSLSLVRLPRKPRLSKTISFFICCFIIIIGSLILPHSSKFILAPILFLYKTSLTFSYTTFDLLSFTNIYGPVIVLLFFVGLIFGQFPEIESILSVHSKVVWVVMTVWLSSLIPSLQIVIFWTIAFTFLGAFLFATYFGDGNTEDSVDSSKQTSSEEKNDPEISMENANNDFDYKTSSLCLIYLSLICSIIVAIQIPYFAHIGICLFFLYGLNVLWSKIGVSWSEWIERFFPKKLRQRGTILMSPTLKILIEVLNKIKNIFINGLRKYCDSITTLFVMVVILSGGLSFIIFMFYQAYREGLFFIQASGSILNSTVINDIRLKQLIPDDWRSKADDTLNNVYIYVRQWMSNLITSFLIKKGLDKRKVYDLEVEALAVWDRTFQAYVTPFQNTDGARTVQVTQDAVTMACQSFYEQLKQTPEVFCWDTGKSLIEENMSTLKTGFDSVMNFIWSNLSFLTNIAFSIFGGSVSAINFMFNWCVFLTALFYLLTTSQEVYKPVQIIIDASPNLGKQLILAIELSCKEVLAASIKLSVFYGLWTWLIHMAFMSNFVYMPAAFATVFGVVPIVGTYWACVPAVIEIWLLQNSKSRALGLFIAQIIPTLSVETIVYNEIKGSGHPYLTGLSVAGGIFWLGIEGAILGPVILCIVFTVLNLISNEVE